MFVKTSSASLVASAPAFVWGNDVVAALIQQQHLQPLLYGERTAEATRLDQGVAQVLDVLKAQHVFI